MLAVPHLYADIEKLPSDMQVEVSHYVSFLLDKIKKKQPIIETTLREQENRSEELYQLMCQIAKEGTIFDRENIDIMAWQKEQRQDRVLVGREGE